MTPKRIIRILEIIPGLAVWSALLLPFILSFYYPGLVAIFILVFDLYWLYKAIIMAYHLLTGYSIMQKYIRTNWIAKLEKLVPDSLTLDYSGVYNAVILATYQEDLDLLRSSIQSLVDSDFPHNRFIFVLATEERDRENAQLNAKALKQEFGDKFAHFLVTVTSQ